MTGSNDELAVMASSGMSPECMPNAARQRAANNHTVRSFYSDNLKYRMILYSAWNSNRLQILRKICGVFLYCPLTTGHFCTRILCEETYHFKFNSRLSLYNPRHVHGNKVTLCGPTTFVFVVTHSSPLLAGVLFSPSIVCLSVSTIAQNVMDR